MPLNQAYLRELSGQEDALAEKETRDELEQRLAEVEDSLALYNDPKFEDFREMMSAEEKSALQLMLNGPDDQVIAMREKLRVLRHLASREDNLRKERARIIRELETQEE